MDMQKRGPRGRSSGINPSPGAAVECKTQGVARGGCWCLELTDALFNDYSHQWKLLSVTYCHNCSSFDSKSWIKLCLMIHPSKTQAGK